MLVAMMAGWINAGITNITTHCLTAPLVCPTASQTATPTKIDLSPIIVQLGQTPLFQKEDRGSDNAPQLTGENWSLLICCLISLG